MFHLKQHNLSEEQINLLNEYINKIILPESTYVMDEEFPKIKFSSIFQENTVYDILTTTKIKNDNKDQHPLIKIREGYTNLQTALNKFAEENKLETIINEILLKNGFILHNMQNCYVQNILSLLIFLYNNHETLYEKTSIAEIDENLLNEIKNEKNKLEIPKTMNFMDNSIILNFDPNNGYSTSSDFYPMNKYELLKRKLKIEPVFDSDSIEVRNTKIANNSRYYMYKIIKLLNTLNYSNFIIYSYKFSVIIYKLYVLNWVDFTDTARLDKMSLNDGTIESLLRYCDFFKPSGVIRRKTKKYIENVNKLRNNKITREEFANIFDIDITSKYYYQKGEGVNRYGSAIKLCQVFTTINPFSIIHVLDKEFKINQTFELRPIYISLVKHIFNLPFENYNDNDRKEINDDLEEINKLPNGIYINATVSNHYHSFIKHNGIYIMFDDVIHNPTITYNEVNSDGINSNEDEENKNIKYKNIKVDEIDGKLYVNPIISNSKISTPIVLENLTEDDDYRLFGKRITVNGVSRRGMFTYNYDTSSISKMTGSSKQSMICNIISIIVVIISIIILIVIAVKMTKIQKTKRSCPKDDL